jgi:hypothetical protein
VLADFASEHGLFGGGSSVVASGFLGGWGFGSDRGGGFRFAFHFADEVVDRATFAGRVWDLWGIGRGRNWDVDGQALASIAHLVFLAGGGGQ